MTALQHNEEWIAKRLRERGLNAEVTAYCSDLTDGSILAGRSVDGELLVQVGEHYVILTAWNEQTSQMKFYGPIFRTLEDLANFIKGVLV